MNLSTRAFEELAARRGDGLASVYMPAHRRGRETRQDPIRFKNLLAEAEAQGLDRGIDKRALRGTLDRARSLLDDDHFWMHQGDGLAVLLGEDHTDVFRLDHPVDEIARVDDHFCVRPLLPSIASGRTFYVLALSQNRVRLVRCTRGEAREIDRHDIPRSLEDALGFDVEQKSLQFRTNAGPSGDQRSAVFHGHGAGSDAEHEQELRRFLKLVDNGLARFFEGVRVPLVVAADRRVFDRFAAISRHRPLMEDGIIGSPDRYQPDELRDLALPIAAPALDADDRAARDRVREAAHGDLVTTDLGHVLRALAEKRVATLVLDPSRAIWGRLRDGRPEGAQPGEPDADDLLDLAVRRGVSEGAEILPAQSDAMPGGATVAAALRY